MREGLTVSIGGDGATGKHLVRRCRGCAASASAVVSPPHGEVDVAPLPRGRTFERMAVFIEVRDLCVHIFYRRFDRWNLGFSGRFVNAERGRWRRHDIAPAYCL